MATVAEALVCDASSLLLGKEDKKNEKKGLGPLSGCHQEGNMSCLSFTQN